MINRRKVIIGGAALSAAISQIGLSAYAQNGHEVVIGALYPLSGSSAQIGIDAKYAMETAVDIINNSYDFNLPLAKPVGLDGLGGAKVRVVFADHQANAQTGKAEAERLITQEKVCGIVGAFHSIVSASASEVCESHQIPYLAADSSSPALHTRGLKYFFRPGAHDILFSRAMFDFMDAQKSAGKKVETIALFYEDTIFGTESAKAQRQLAEVRGYKVVADVKYHANAQSLTAEVEQLKAANADVVLPSCYTADALLLVRTMKEQNYKPSNMIAQAAGFSEKNVYDAVGDQLDGIVSRASFSLDIAPKRPAIPMVNDLFKQRAKRDLNDNTARQFMGLLIMADAVNRAQSIEGPKIRDALAETNIPGDETIMPWRFVKFASDGQSPTADPILVQYVDGQFSTVFPETVAVRPAKWPMNG